ncbi:MAG: hypothetical protein ACSHYB_02055 [Roseibacillus sp.]
MASNFSIAFLLTLLATHCWALPFEVTSPSEIRADATISWEDVALTTGSTLAADSYTTFSNSNQLTAGVTTQAASAEFRNTGYFTPGMLLQHNGGNRLLIYPPSPVQGFAVTVEHSLGVQADYIVSFYDFTGHFLFSTSRSSPGVQGNPVFLGMIDPEARIAIIGIEASPGNTFAIADPLFQHKPPAPPTLSELPAISTLDEPLSVSSSETYLHEGYGVRNSTPETNEATLTNGNAHDLLALFPDLRTGDILRFKRIGNGRKDNGETNPLLGVLSSSNHILKGSEFQRVPDAISAGSTYHTEKAKGFGSVSTPTNIPEDFPIGPETHITYRAGARYLFLTRADTEVQSQPVSLRISHIPNTMLLDWINEHGLTGINADLQSDLDGDGLTLLEEFAFRKDPTQSDAAENADYSFAPDLSPYSSESLVPLSLAFGGRRDAPLRYIGQFSSNLTDWDTVPISNPFLTDEEASANSVFLFSDPEPGPTRFGKLLIEYIQPASN